MRKELIGFLTLVGGVHLVLVFIPDTNTLRSPSRLNKLFWCAFLVLLPFVGAYVFHRRFRSSLFHGKPYQISAAEIGAAIFLDPDPRQAAPGVNGGHDLDLVNLSEFLKIEGILEVSIGHSLTVECIEQGMQRVVQTYLDICSNAGSSHICDTRKKGSAILERHCELAARTVCA